MGNIVDARFYNAARRATNRRGLRLSCRHERSRRGGNGGSRYNCGL